ncbi:MAG: transposase [Candidatus Omnitrophota bacterium]
MGRDILAIGEVYHIFNKSIAGFQIFNDDADYQRMVNLIAYYQQEKPPLKFSQVYLNSKEILERESLSEKDKLVEIIAYCIMPTHFHLILKQIKENGISIFMKNVLDSYSRYFNILHKRKGPLWEGRFKRVNIKTDEQLYHLTRYIHLNPVTAYLVNKPEDWPASSYWEYLELVGEKEKICHFEGLMEINPRSYKEFVEDRASYQRELAKIKNLIIEHIP